MNDNEEALRSRCHGLPPLEARLESWQLELCADADRLAHLLEVHGSPVNIHHWGPLTTNVAELVDAAATRNVDLRVFIARKANKTLSLVDSARALGHGVDLASLSELEQALGRGMTGADLVMTAAVKPEALLRACVASGTLIVLDNTDETELLLRVVAEDPFRAAVALRLAPDGMDTRFGMRAEELRDVAARLRSSGVRLSGLHFHLDGYAPADRVAAATEALELIDELRDAGHRIEFLDIGGGIPMSYLPSRDQWETFWERHVEGLASGTPLTYRGEGLGFQRINGAVHGARGTYPYHQQPVRGAWLANVLDARVRVAGVTSTLASAVEARGLRLHCEPGRSVMDGCGMTVARVEFRKRDTMGHALIGVAMNRTQCRSTSADFLVDPLLLRPRVIGSGVRSPESPLEGHLVGAYCIERELLTWRRLAFPTGVAVGDLIVFPNTAGYLMHILESASHQIPLARNLVLDNVGTVDIDGIDTP